MPSSEKAIRASRWILTRNMIRRRWSRPRLSLQQYKDPDVRAVAEDLLLISDVKYIITNVSKKGFEIMMDHKADSDIPFSWHALAVNDPSPRRRKGRKLKSKIGNDLNPGQLRGN